MAHARRKFVELHVAKKSMLPAMPRRPSVPTHGDFSAPGGAAHFFGTCGVAFQSWAAYDLH